MPNVLIRDVPEEDLDRIRSAAAEEGVSMQSYLREALHVHASGQRRREALSRMAERLHGLPPVPEEDRQAVLDAMDEAVKERAEELADRLEP
jgi:hypothetical protein